MESADVIVVSSKGQVVIPQSLRRKLGIEAKTKLLVYHYSGSLIMKRLDIGDAKNELKSVFKAIDSRRREEKVTEEEVNEMVQRHRHGKETRRRAIENRSGHKRPGLGSDN
jgi:AbrB family looped-hinge helix DNA binding protein